jgi:hypothetical protein
MQYILFMMFLITLPGQSIPKEKRLFTLQTTQSIEFDSADACTVARNSIADSVAITDTILLVSSCLPKGQLKSQTKDGEKHIEGGTSQFLEKKPERPRNSPDANGVIQFNTLSR